MGYLDSEGAVEEVDRKESRVELEEVRDFLHTGGYTIVYWSLLIAQHDRGKSMMGAGEDVGA